MKTNTNDKDEVRSLPTDKHLQLLRKDLGCRFDTLKNVCQLASSESMVVRGKHTEHYGPEIKPLKSANDLYAAMSDVMLKLSIFEQEFLENQVPAKAYAAWFEFQNKKMSLEGPVKK